MTLIMPRSETQPSMVQQPRLPEGEPGLGAALAEGGQLAVGFIAAAKERERSAQMRAARVSAVEQLGALRTRFEQDPNVAGLSERWGTESGQIITALADSLPEGRMREDFLLDTREMLAPQTQAIARREFALSRDAARAQGRQAIETFVGQAATAPDAESERGILGEGAAVIAGLRQDGFITAEEEQAWLSSAASDASLARALRHAADDPADFLQARADGEFDNLPPATLERMVTAAQADVAQAEAAAARAAEVSAREEAELVSGDVDDAINILESGGIYRNVNELLDRAEGTEDHDRLMAALTFSREEIGFSLQDPATQAERIAEREATPTRDPEDIARLQTMRRIRNQTIEAVRDDPMGFVHTRGITTLTSVDISDPTSVGARLALARSVYQRFGQNTPGGGFRIFTNEERDALQAQVAQGAVEDQLAVATQVVGTFGDAALPALAEIGADDPLFLAAGRLVATGGNVTAARNILQGRALRAEGNDAKVSNAVRATVRAQIAAALPPGQSGQIGTLLTAADAHYATSGFLIDPEADDETKRDAYMRSVQAVAGLRVVNGQAYGGFQDVNGYLTLLPPNVTAGQAQGAYMSAAIEDWQAASANGTEPYHGETSFTVLRESGELISDARRFRMIATGGGLYGIQYQMQDGSWRYLTDRPVRNGVALSRPEAPVAQGNLFLFDLAELARRRAP